MTGTTQHNKQIIPIEIEKLFDVQTSQLFDEIKEYYNVTFEPWENNFAAVNSQRNNAVISYHPDTVNTPTIAHELLHLWLNRFNLISSNYLRILMSEHHFLSEVFDTRLTEFIFNCMEHYKMYPKYVEMGYHPRDFILNGGKKQCSLFDVWGLYLKEDDKYDAKSVNRYIGYLFSIYADHCKNNYKWHLKSLKKNNNDLFYIVSDFWEKWTLFDIESINADNSDIELIDEFMDEMRTWCSKNGIE